MPFSWMRESFCQK
ncbi:unnamed protein product [Acanthoscelides obtectus]|uniref:Uncharacterized protein n=1 Tax=Acanthoscelides obtectus TaxID=200917 RepID=A0A9P0M972_ACAOB|nr:unnamed protein product [Acanthoscelides obtectus]CAH2011615.1 unnamed protein product [Acanthoscelides obtectus]